ncbi:hypothetical protein E2562_020647 [Oryza meyeriana var. granulata]|uniref:Uncharacterized protein n=1 Tax=Oryza meyeriana var. granulata TaxID=110450 RepID=A0A6G1EB01_9ORYZ|nr:hypothetical protein E2562_020647 [Oryza meyeriana var. granulata]
MRRRTFLPYHQGLLFGCLGLSSRGCGGAMRGLSAAAKSSGVSWHEEMQPSHFILPSKRPTSRVGLALQLALKLTICSNRFLRTPCTKADAATAATSREHQQATTLGVAPHPLAPRRAGGPSPPRLHSIPSASGTTAGRPIPSAPPKWNGLEVLNTP